MNYSISPQQAAQEILRRLKAKDDLRAFAKAIEIPGAPIDDDPEAWLFRPIETSIAAHHDLMMSAIQRTMETRHGRLMLFLPPGSAKSTYASVVAPTWYMGRNPNSRIILASYASDLARRHGKRARAICKQAGYRAIFGTEISAETSAADEWAITNGSEYLAFGIQAGVTGSRGHGLIIDDPVRGREEADSETIQKKTVAAYEDDLKTRLIPGGWVCIVQTRWHELDLAGQILPANWQGESGEILCRDGFTWTVLCIQAECTRADDPLGRKPGEMLWTEWFDDKHWANFRTKPRTWSALFQQVPTPDDGAFFKKDWFRYYDGLPKHLNFYATSDYAVTDGSGDYTVHAVWAVDADENLYLVDLWRGQTTPDLWIEQQLDMVHKYEPLTWFGEGGVIQKSVEPFLIKRMRERRDWQSLEWLPSIHDKPTRARSFQARMAQGKVYLPKSKEWMPDFESELLRFPAGTNDDQVDACSLIGRGLDATVSANLPREKKPGPKPGTLDHLLQSGRQQKKPSIYRGR